MKDNLIHVCFVVDESGSMYGSVSDVIGGFERTIKEQSENKDGECIVSLFTFNDKVKELYLGKNIKDVKTIDYHPGGCTALFDGVGTAIDKVGKWLSDMDESERPSKNLIVIMTDGAENASKEYKSNQVKEKIKHQEDKYSWSFIYMGADVTDSKDADSLGFDTKLYNSKDSLYKSFDVIKTSLNCYRSASANGKSASEASATMDSCMRMMADDVTKDFEKEIGKKISN